jgi:vancomycin resistance protein VanJ
VLTRARLIEAVPLAASRRGSASRIVVETRDGPLAIRAIDLPSDPRLSRRATAGELVKTIDAIDRSTPDVILGDFNITGGSDSLRQFGEGYRDSFEDAGAGWGGTYPRETPLWRIDLTLVRTPWRTLRAEVIDLHGKRHRAQVVDIHRTK